MSSKEIKSIREKTHLSQAAFASYLNLTVGYISQLERGLKEPTGAVLALLNIIRRRGFDVIWQQKKSPVTIRDSRKYTNITLNNLEISVRMMDQDFFRKNSRYFTCSVRRRQNLQKLFNCLRLS